MITPVTLAGPSVETLGDIRLLTKDDIKAYMNDAGIVSWQDTVLDRIADRISLRAFAEMGNRFLLNKQLWDQLIDGPYGQTLVLPQRPIVTITSLEYGRFDGNTWTVIESYASTDYFLDKASGRIIRTGPWSFPRGPLALRCKYNAGFAVTPPDLKHELVTWGVVAFKRIIGDRIDKTTVSHEAEVTTYKFDEVPDGARDVLNYYKLKESALA